MKILKLILAISLMSMIIGCQKKDDKKVILEDIYKQNRLEGHQETFQLMRERFSLNDGFGTQKPYVPIISMPETKKIWVPNQYLAEDDALSQGHWVFLKIYDGDFIIKRSNPVSPYGLSNLSKITGPEVKYDAKVVHDKMKNKASGMKSRQRDRFSVPVSFVEENEEENSKGSSGAEGDNEAFNNVYK